MLLAKHLYSIYCGDNYGYVDPMRVQTYCHLVLKGIIGYSDYSLAGMIFECFKSNGIFVFLFKALHLTTSVDRLLIFCYIMDI